MKKSISYNAPVILSFAFLSLLALGLGVLTEGRSTYAYFTIYRSSPLDPLTYVRLFGHVLGHVDWQHYSGNMMILLLTGPMLEEKYGSRRLLAVIALTAVLSGIVNLLLFPNTAVLGASGVAFAFILLSSITGAERGQIPLTLILVAAIYLGGEVISGFFYDDQVSQLSHVMGGVVGAMLGYLFMQEKKPSELPL